MTVIPGVVIGWVVLGIANVLTLARIYSKGPVSMPQAESDEPVRYEKQIARDRRQAGGLASRRFVAVRYKR